LGPTLKEWVIHLRARRPSGEARELADAIFADGEEFVRLLRNPLLHGHYVTQDSEGYLSTTQLQPIGGEAMVLHGGAVRRAASTIKEALDAGCILSLKLALLRTKL